MNTKTKILLFLLIMVSCLCGVNPNLALANKNTHVFPSAEGFGIYTPAGRNGKLIRVTNLKDSGPGSLREAIETKGPRTVVFEVSGEIKLKERLRITAPFLTIAGQTSPDPGIIITGHTISIESSDMLIQHIAIRVGDKGKEGKTNEDCIQIIKGNNIVIDHVSMSWATDENLGIGMNASNVTISNSIISEPLFSIKNPLGPSGYAVLLGETSQNIAIIKTIISDAKSRMPRVQSGSFHLSNNLIVNKNDEYFCSIGTNDEKPTYLAAVGNVFIDGYNSKGKKAFVENTHKIGKGSQIYLKDNCYSGIIYVGKHRVDVIPQNTWPEIINIIETDRVKEELLKKSGARPKNRDAVDKRTIKNIKRNTGILVRSQKEVGGFPIYDYKYRKFHLDNPFNDDDKNGYTNLEDHLYLLSKELINCDNE